MAGFPPDEVPKARDFGGLFHLVFLPTRVLKTRPQVGRGVHLDIWSCVFLFYDPGQLAGLTRERHEVLS